MQRSGDAGGEGLERPRSATVFVAVAADVMAFAQHLLALRKQVDRTRQRRLSPAGRRFSNDHVGAAHDLERPGTAQRFFDRVLDAFAPYLVVYRMLHRDGISGPTLWGHDRVVVPLSRLLQAVLGNQPLGKNVVLIAVER